jgi:hypothetical protein
LKSQRVYLSKRVPARFRCVAGKLHLFGGGKRLLGGKVACELYLICYVSTCVPDRMFEIAGFSQAFLFLLGG